MQLIRWTDVPREKIGTSVERQVVWGERATFVRYSFLKDTHISRHRHEGEQHTYILEGAIRVSVSSTEIVLRAGEGLVIPSWVDHEVWVMEDTVLIDFFAPARNDWREGAHTSKYLEGD